MRPLTAKMNASLRLSALFFMMFLAVGIQLPYWPLWLRAQGLDGEQIGQALALTYLAKIIFNPLAGGIVDHLNSRRKPLIVLGLLTACGFALFALTPGVVAIMALTFLANGLFSAMIPISDNLALMKAAELHLDYPRLRLWGSIGFVVAALACGRWLTQAPPEMIQPLMTVALAGLAALCFALPDAAVPLAKDLPTQSPRQGSLRDLLGDRRFLAFLGVSALLQMALAVYYGFATLHWRSEGVSEATIGNLWSCGVVAEILFFASAKRFVHRCHPASLIAVGGAGGLLRWSLLAFTSSPPLLMAAQTLHAATFACAHLGAMAMIGRIVPAPLSGRAQGLYSSVATGLIPGLTLPLMGGLYQSFGGLTFLLASLFSLLALLGALAMRRRM